MPANTSGPPAKKKGRRARLLVIVVVLLLVSGIGYGSYWTVSTVRASFPQTTGTLQLKGLAGPVRVDRDAQGIPQIYADSTADLFRAQGYVQAQDRFYEMDVRRHFTAGRLSEMFGSSDVDNDAFIRTLGMRQVAQQEWDTQLSAETKANVRAYTDGVNAYLSGHHGAALSMEYTALDLSNGYKPEPWTPVDSVSWLKAMAWDLRGNMQDEIDRALMTSRLSTAQIEQLYPAYPYDRNQPIVDGGTVAGGGKDFVPQGGTSTASAPGTNSASGQLSALAKTVDNMPALLGPTGNGIGSNAWVVSGKYTTTGKPLLANDPHLAPQLPSVWYQMGLHCRTVSASCPYDVTGYTFAGMPGVVIGHNQNIAWGLTNMGADTTDLYLEKVTGNSYLFDGKQVPFTTRQETIKVAGGGSRTITVRVANNGMPVISDVSDEMANVGQEAPVTDPAPDRRGGYAVALRWSALTPGKTMDAVFAVDKAADFDQFRAAAADFSAPAQNLVYADTKGHIGYQATGQIPVRAKGFDGRWPAPGWDSRAQWTGWVPRTALPYEEDPKRGYIVTANQAVAAKDYPYEITDDWGYGTRSQRINDLIQSKLTGGGKISMDDMQSMQMDNSSEIAKLLVPYLLKINVTDPYVRQAQQLLEGWDFSQSSDSAAAAYFNAVWRNTLKLAFGNKMPKELRPKGQCLWVTPVNDSGQANNLGSGQHLVNECGQRDPSQAQPDGGDRWFEVVREVLPNADSPWWTSTTKGEPAHNRDELLAQAMKDARFELTAKLGKNIDTWSWGRLHKMELRNQTLGSGDNPALVKWLLNRGPWQLSGGEAAVDASGWNAAGGFDVVWVPSMRMIVNLDDFDRSRWINLTGASGHAYSAHYTDQTNMWVNGQLLQWSYTGGAVDKGTKDKLTLTP